MKTLLIDITFALNKWLKAHIKFAMLHILVAFVANTAEVSASSEVAAPSSPENKIAISNATRSALMNLGDHSLIGPVFDAQDRAWFGEGLWEVDGLLLHRPLDSMDHIRALYKSRARKPRVLGGVTPILWDKQNRLWVCGWDNADLLEGLDISTGQRIRRVSLTPEIRADLLRRQLPEKFFFQRRSSQNKETGAILNSKQLVGDAFRPTAFQSRKGDLFFADTFGIHVLSGGQWSYQMTFERLYKTFLSPEFLSSHPLHVPVHFAENKDGQVYMWTPNGKDSDENTKGFWMWERGHWQHIKHVPHVLAVAPRAEGVWVFSREGELFLWTKGQWISRGSAHHLLYSPLIWKNQNS
ncbi:MAG TPA: hypothetical protein VGB77_21965 [Abditibacteriaceae bacterium]|jgi:hypothetical protein